MKIRTRLAGTMVLASLAALALGAEPIPVARHIWKKDRFYRAIVAPDGMLYYFEKLSSGEEDYRIFTAHALADGTWSEASPLRLGDDASDLYPTVSPDGQVLVFTSYRPIPGAAPEDKPNGHIWYCLREGDGWGEPRYAPTLNEPGHYHSGLLFDATDATLRFRRTTPDWTISVPLAAHWNGESWSTAETDAAAARWTGDRGDRYYWGHLPSPDGRFALVFASEYEPGTRRRKPARTFVTQFRNGGWTSPRPLDDAINEQSPNFWSFLPNGGGLLFTLNYSSLHRISIAEILATTAEP